MTTAAPPAGPRTAFDATIAHTYFAQTHVMAPEQRYFRLVGGRDTLIKVHVISPTRSAAPRVTVDLALGDQRGTLELAGPARLPEAFDAAPERVEHRFDDCFTAMIPGQWIRRGLKLTIRAGDARRAVDDLNIGAPTHLKLTMFDIHYFNYEDVDYPDDWEEELLLKRPVASWQVQRRKRILFQELIIPPRGGHPATRCACTDDYQTKNGEPFNGKQVAALHWQSALQAAGGQKRIGIYYVSIANVAAGGNAWNFGGCGSLRRFPVLHHEMGHCLNAPDLPDPDHPYVGPLHGIDKSTHDGIHIGATWGFDPRPGLPGAPADEPRFISSKLSNDSLTGNPGEWRNSPMGGGGRGQEPGFPLAIFSDYEVNLMQRYLEDHVVVWNDKLQAYASWDDATGDYTRRVENDGVSLPVERDVEVYSVMAGICAATPQEGNFIYPVIGPYVSGLIDLFDPTVEADRRRARVVYGAEARFDVSMQIVQERRTRTVMLPVAYDPGSDPLDGSSLKTYAVNVPVRDGRVLSARLLLTPRVDLDGMPADPEVLYAADACVTLAGEPA